MKLLWWFKLLHFRWNLNKSLTYLCEVLFLQPAAQNWSGLARNQLLTVGRMNVHWRNSHLDPLLRKFSLKSALGQKIKYFRFFSHIKYHFLWVGKEIYTSSIFLNLPTKLLDGQNSHLDPLLREFGLKSALGQKMKYLDFFHI